MTNVTNLPEPLQLETASGDGSLDTVGDLICGVAVCRGCVFVLGVSLFSAARREKDGYFCAWCHEGHGVLRGPGRDIKLERFRGRDCLVGGDEEVAAHLPWTTWTLNFCVADICILTQVAPRARP